MTLSSIKAEVREKLEIELSEIFCGKLLHEEKENLMSFLNTALDTVAEATKDAIVPEEKEMEAHRCLDDFCSHYPRTDAHNSCRTQTLQNYQEFTK